MSETWTRDDLIEMIHNLAEAAKTYGELDAGTGCDINTLDIVRADEALEKYDRFFATGFADEGNSDDGLDCESTHFKHGTCIHKPGHEGRHKGFDGGTWS